MLRLPEVKPRVEVIKPGMPTQDTLPVYLALKRGLECFGDSHFELTIPPEKERDHSVLHMSSIGYCGRRQWFQLHHTDEYAQLDKGSVGPYLHLGHMIESYTISVLTLGGLTPYGTQQELTDIRGKVIGHIDGIIDVNGVPHLLEIKGLRHESIEKLVYYKLQHAIPTYFAQMQYYMFSLGLAAGYFLALDKNTSVWYIERVIFSGEYATFLRRKAMVLLGARSMNDIPENFVVRDCTWCPLKEKCADMEGESLFIQKYVEYQKVRP